MNVYEKEKRNLLIEFLIFIIASVTSIGYLLSLLMDS